MQTEYRDLLDFKEHKELKDPGLVASQRLRRIFGDEFDNKVAQYQHMSADGKCVQVEMIAGTILDLINASGHTDTIVPIFSMVDQ